MQFDFSGGVEVKAHQACVVFDTRSGAVAHIHESITLQGAEPPSPEALAAQALDHFRAFARETQLTRLDTVDVLHVPPEGLASGGTVTVDLRTRRLVVAEAAGAPSLQGGRMSD